MCIVYSSPHIVHVLVFQRYWLCRLFMSIATMFANYIHTYFKGKFHGYMIRYLNSCKRNIPHLTITNCTIISIIIHPKITDLVNPYLLP